MIVSYASFTMTVICLLSTKIILACIWHEVHSKHNTDISSGCSAWRWHQQLVSGWARQVAGLTYY